MSPVYPAADWDRRAAHTYCVDGVEICFACAETLGEAQAGRTLAPRDCRGDRIHCQLCNWLIRVPPGWWLSGAVDAQAALRALRLAEIRPICPTCRRSISSVSP